MSPVSATVSISQYNSFDIIALPSQIPARHHAGQDSNETSKAGNPDRRNGASAAKISTLAGYSIASSARASSVGGIVRPRARAVLRLMTNSNADDCTTGRSDGLAP